MPKNTQNYHTIEFISHSSKVMLKILQARLQQYVNHELTDVQAGFRKGRGLFICSLGFPGGSGGKESICNGGDLGLIPGLGRAPGGGHGNPLQSSCLENGRGQKSLVVYSPWFCKESETEQRSTAQQ